MAAAEMRSRSMTYAQIGEAMGVTASAAYVMVQRAFASLPSENIVEAKANELAKLDRIEARLLDTMERGHVAINAQGVVVYNDEPITDDDVGIRAAHALLRLQERRAKLLGLDAPGKQITMVVTQEAVDAEIQQLESRVSSMQDDPDVIETTSTNVAEEPKRT
jgi:hypothetical protein